MTAYLYLFVYQRQTLGHLLSQLSGLCEATLCTFAMICIGHSSAQFVFVVITHWYKTARLHDEYKREIKSYLAG